LKGQGKPIEFDSHLRVFSFFVKYQQRAWEIFYKYRDLIKGMDKPISSYLDSYSEFTKNYQENGDFVKMLDKYAKGYKETEEKVLHALFKNQKKINQVLSDGILLN